MSVRIRKKPPVSLPRAFWDIHRDGVTQSMLANFMICPEKTRLGMQLGLRRVQTGGPLAFGSLVHEVLGNTYGVFNPAATEGPVRKDHVMEYVRSMLRLIETRDRERLADMINKPESAEQDLELTQGLALPVLLAYFERWWSDFTEIHWRGLEEVFEFYLLPEVTGSDRPIPVRGKYDGHYLTAKKQELWLFETKTKSRVDEDTLLDRLGLDLQVMLYLHALRIAEEGKHDGKRPRGVLYNIIRRPQLKQGTKESFPQFLKRVSDDIASRPDFYFSRYTVAVSQDELDRGWCDLIGMVRSLVSWTKADWHYRNSAACELRYGACEYLALCGRQDDTGLVRREEVFPELTAEDS